MTERYASGYYQVGDPVVVPSTVTTTGGPITYMDIRTPPDCEEYVTPEGLVRECVDPDLRRITQEVVTPTRVEADRAHERALLRPWLHPDILRITRALYRVEAGRAAIEAEGFVLAYERPL